MNQPINLFDYEAIAPHHLSKMALDYYASGAWDEVTLRDNRAAFERYKLRPRILQDVSQRDLRTTLLGQPLAIPILVAPMAFQGLANPDGERATATAALKLGAGMVLSTLSNQPLEAVAQVAKEQQADRTLPIASPLWFQLYIHRDRGLSRALVERAEAAGFNALCLTVDAPILGRRERDRHNEFALPPELDLANLATMADLEIAKQSGESGLLTYFAQQIDPGITWKDIEWLRSIASLPLVVKGVLRGDDALTAVDCGVSGIVVSNHGGRQLDSAIASIDALGEVVAAVGDRAEVLVDGGIRRGTDILKALALGAKAVLVGRPVLWGLAVGGEAGVHHVLQLLRDELDAAIALSGCANIQDLDRSLLTRI